jgi:phospho-N-acetylmuramoyl-pentapeptide-transferase
MLYALFQLFEINIFQYITFRAGVSFFLALSITLWIMPKFIKWAIKKELNQPIYDLVEIQQDKKNTPTMGGIVFVLATIFSTLLTAHLANFYVIGAILTIVLFTLIGFKDDFGKIAKKNNTAGLSPKNKFLLQIVSALIVSSYLFYLNFSTEFYIPFYKSPLFDMGIFAIPFFTLVFISSSNGVNLTDGLDGLATTPAIFAISTLGVFAYIVGNVLISSYLLLPSVSGVGEVAIIGSAFVGALIGFLWYNSHPAEVFMGDSGSLSIGAFVGYMAIVTKNEILLILIGSVFVIESLSVLIQVASFKTRKKRIFLMAPLHHHFEMKNLSENKIIIRFWIIALLSNLIALISMKIR